MPKGVVHRGEPFVADREAPVAGEPGQGPLDHPPMPAQSRLRFDARARDAVLDPPAATRRPALAIVVPLSSMQLGGPAPRAAAPPGLQRRDRVEHRLEQHRVVDVGRRHRTGERDALGIRNNMLLRARVAFLRRVLPGRTAPLWAGRLRESTTARLQAICSAAAKRSSRTRCNRCQTPRRCHALRRRQQVTPLPQPISCGTYAPGIPVWSTKRMPVNAARFGTGGRPPLRLRRCVGNSGSITAHSSSETNTCIPECYPTPAWRF